MSDESPTNEPAEPLFGEEMYRIEDIPSAVRALTVATNDGDLSDNDRERVAEEALKQTIRADDHLIGDVLGPVQNCLDCTKKEAKALRQQVIQEYVLGMVDVEHITIITRNDPDDPELHEWDVRVDGSSPTWRFELSDLNSPTRFNEYLFSAAFERVKFNDWDRWLSNTYDDVSDRGEVERKEEEKLGKQYDVREAVLDEMRGMNVTTDVKQLSDGYDSYLFYENEDEPVVRMRSKTITVIGENTVKNPPTNAQVKEAMKDLLVDEIKPIHVGNGSQRVWTFGFDKLREAGVLPDEVTVLSPDGADFVVGAGGEVVDAE